MKLTGQNGSQEKLHPNPLGSGMGLGLSLVKNLLKDVRGKIELLSSPPPGFNTCFKLSFPR